MNVEEIQASKPVRLDNRLQVNFSPSQCRPFDFLPLIGQASRSYDPIKRNVQTPQEAGLALTSSQKQVRALESCNEFRSRLNSDERGCKPTGVAMTSDGRMSIAGLTSGNVDYVSEAFHAVTKDYKDLTLDQF